jgi:FkbM family methyltransferase
MKFVNGWAFPLFDSHFKKYVSNYPETFYQQEVFEESLKYVKDFKVAIDAGANVGLHSVRFAKKFNKVYSFEPSAENFICLEKNCGNDKNIKLYNLGLGKIQEDKKLKLPKLSNNCGLFSTSEYNLLDESSLKEEQIKIITIDSLGLETNLIKIDTQGSELEILQGAENTINSYKPVITVELERKKIREDVSIFLKKLKYKLVKKIGKDNIWISL